MQAGEDDSMPNEEEEEGTRSKKDTILTVPPK